MGPTAVTTTDCQTAMAAGSNRTRHNPISHPLPLSQPPTLAPLCPPVLPPPPPVPLPLPLPLTHTPRPLVCVSHDQLGNSSSSSNILTDHCTGSSSTFISDTRSGSNSLLISRRGDDSSYVSHSEEVSLNPNQITPPTPPPTSLSGGASLADTSQPHHILSIAHQLEPLDLSMKPTWDATNWLHHLFYHHCRQPRPIAQG